MGLLNKLEKLCEMSCEEIIYRSAFNVNAFTERTIAGFFLDKEISLPSSHIIKSKLISIPCLQHYYGQCSKQRTEILKNADAVVKKSIKILGYNSFLYSSDIDWHFDPINEVRNHMVHWSLIKYGDLLQTGDARIIGELNRHNYLVRVGQAYCITRDEKYAQCVIEIIVNWIENNPKKMGINWASPANCAFRMIAWIWSLSLVKNSQILTEQILHRIIRSVVDMAGHVTKYLSHYSSPNTHLTAEGLALFYVGTLLPYLACSGRWKQIGEKILLDCVNNHVLSDGGYMERSLWYHRYTLDIYIHFYRLSRTNNSLHHAEVKKAILKLGEFLMYASCPDQSFPLIGDDDGGRLLPLDNLAGNDLKGVFSTLAVLFNRADFKYLSGGYQEETLWMLGMESQDIFNSIVASRPNKTAAAFPETGYFFMRSDWSKEAAYLAFDCGPHGWLNCGHAHADLLSLQINSGSTPIIVDPGTFSYVGKERNDFRGPLYHSTIIVDGIHPAVPGTPFSWKKTPRHRLATWVTGGNVDHIAGYLEYNGSWKHLREVFFIKPMLFLLVDNLEWTGEHLVQLRFPLSGTEWRLQGDLTLTRAGAPSATIQFSFREGFVCRTEESYVSPCYGKKELSCVAIYQGRGVFPLMIGTLVNLSPELLVFENTDPGDSDYLSIVSKQSGKTIFQYQR